MRVLHLTDGLPMIPLCQALRDRGIEATSCHFFNNGLEVPVDICLNLQNYKKEMQLQKMKEYLYDVLENFDIFHFHFGFTFLPDKTDLKLLKQANKKMIVHHQGSEARLLSVAKSFNNPYVRVKSYWTEERIHQNLRILSDHIDDVIISYYELKPYVEKYYKRIHFIPNPIDLRQIKSHFPNPSKPCPIVVHAPSNRFLKGTEYVIDAVEHLQRKGLDFQFQLVENMTNHEAHNLYRKADIIIDQLRIGDYGYLSIEAMALGKPVICYVRDDLYNMYKDLPIVNATPDTIASVLENLLINPQKRLQLGIQGRSYAERFHEAIKAADSLIELYRKL